MPVHVQHFFESRTSTCTYIVYDKKTLTTAIIDSVLDFDLSSGKITTQSADRIIEYVQLNNLKVAWILETHIHADHITAASYLKEKIGGKIGVGSQIKEVLKFWVPIFNTYHDTPLDGSQFDMLFEDNDTISLGSKVFKFIYTPGHTPACGCYFIEDSVFVGDTLFMPDIGTARTDFPGGSAEKLYDSIQTILSFNQNTKIYVGHDYPPQNREASYLSTIKEQKLKNVIINDRISKEQFVNLRNKRDHDKEVPKLLLPSLQMNLRAGTIGKKEENGVSYIKIPVNKI